MVTLDVTYAANGTGIIGAVVCFCKLRAEVSTASPQAFRKKIERPKKEVVDLKGAFRTTTTPIVAPERLVKCGDHPLKLLVGALQAVEQSMLDKN